MKSKANFGDSMSFNNDGVQGIDVHCKHHPQYDSTFQSPTRLQEGKKRPKGQETNRKQQHQRLSSCLHRHGNSNFRKDRHHSRSKYDGSFLHAQWLVLVAWSTWILLSLKARRITDVPKSTQTRQCTNQHSDPRAKWNSSSLHPCCRHITNHKYHRRRKWSQCFGFGKLDPLTRKLENAKHNKIQNLCK